jgi:Uma2 family endonuclease
LLEELVALGIEFRGQPQLEGTAMSVDPRPLTLADFLAWEARQQTKHEFRNGAIFAMAGATDDHGQIVTNLIAVIRPVSRGSACPLFQFRSRPADRVQLLRA